MYDIENKMTAQYMLAGEPNDTAVLLYGYDSFGRRVSKSRATGTDSTSGTLYEAYSYAGDRVIADYNGDGDIRYRFIYGEGIDEVVCMMKTTVEGQKRTTAISPMNSAALPPFTARTQTPLSKATPMMRMDAPIPLLPMVIHTALPADASTRNPSFTLTVQDTIIPNWVYSYPTTRSAISTQ